MMPVRAWAVFAVLPLSLGAADNGPPVPGSMRLDYVIKRDGDPIPLRDAASDEGVSGKISVNLYGESQRCEEHDRAGRTGWW